MLALGRCRKRERGSERTVRQSIVAHGVYSRPASLAARLTVSIQYFMPVSKHFEYRFGNNTGKVDEVDCKMREHDGR